MFLVYRAHILLLVSCSTYDMQQIFSTVHYLSMEGHQSKNIRLATKGEISKKRSLSKRVNVGVDGSTPKKEIIINTLESKKVNVGSEGMTPKKIVNSDGTTKAYNFMKKVNVGDEGHTPIKTFEYFQNIPIAAAPNRARFSGTVPAIVNTLPKNKLSSFSNEDLPLPPPPNNNGYDSARSLSSADQAAVARVYPEVGTDLPSPTSRPKTSRGKSHPSPDEFFDYVVPSPPPMKHRSPNHLATAEPNVALPVDAAIYRYSQDEGDTKEVTAEVLEVDDWNEVDGSDFQSETDKSSENFIEAEEEIYEVDGSESEGAVEDDDQTQQRHIHMRGEDEQRNKQVRMLACWLFGSTLRI